MIKKVQRSGIIAKLMQMLLDVTPNIFQFKKNDNKSKQNLRYFIGFIVHCFRFLIVCQSIDHICLSKDPGLSATLSQVLRKYELFKQVFP
jgi:hypothetical protein